MQEENHDAVHESRVGFQHHATGFCSYIFQDKNLQTLLSKNLGLNYYCFLEGILKKRNNAIVIENRESITFVATGC